MSQKKNHSTGIQVHTTVIDAAGHRGGFSQTFSAMLEVHEGNEAEEHMQTKYICRHHHRPWGARRCH